MEHISLRILSITKETNIWDCLCIKRKRNFCSRGCHHCGGKCGIGRYYNCSRSNVCEKGDGRRAYFFAKGGDEAVINAPASGTLTALFPTGHAFGITMADGVELLIHIGIDTVNTNGDEFSLMRVKQGQYITAGTPIVKVNLKELKKKYYTGVMLIITNSSGKELHLKKEGIVKAGERLN